MKKEMQINQDKFYLLKGLFYHEFQKMIIYTNITDDKDIGINSREFGKITIVALDIRTSTNYY